MREPVFNETLQLRIVVRDLEATMRRYVDDYGIGPWEVYEFDAGKAEDFREYGQPVELPGALLSPRSARCSGS
jgi:methylmalonyl-CoA/ethylmalonyl-CoA epimerase